MPSVMSIGKYRAWHVNLRCSMLGAESMHRIHGTLGIPTAASFAARAAALKSSEVEREQI